MEAGAFELLLELRHHGLDTTIVGVDRGSASISPARAFEAPQQDVLRQLSAALRSEPAGALSLDDSLAATIWQRSSRLEPPLPI